jgi:hypothetical protein
LALVLILALVLTLALILVLTLVLALILTGIEREKVDVFGSHGSYLMVKADPA